MSHRVAVLLDGGFVQKRLLARQGGRAPADTDFVPAMEFARREGVQVVLVPMGSRTLNKALRAHADEVRAVA